MNNSESNAFAQVLGYRFNNAQLLQRALTHSSTEKPNNENLEFLGDTILCTVISDYLYRNYPDATEGELTILRSQIINNQNAIYSVALDISLEDYIKVGKSFPKNNQNAWRNLLPNALEALIGAIYLDGGMNRARQFILDKFQSLIEESSIKGRKDSKTQLQEFLQKRSLPIPIYSTVDVSGKPNDPSITVACRVEGVIETVTSRGSSKKEAEQEAAAQVYDLLCQQKI